MSKLKAPANKVQLWIRFWSPSRAGSRLGKAPRLRHFSFRSEQSTTLFVLEFFFGSPTAPACYHPHMPIGRPFGIRPARWTKKSRRALRRLVQSRRVLLARGAAMRSSHAAPLIVTPRVTKRKVAHFKREHSKLGGSGNVQRQYRGNELASANAARA